jgi:penicillin-binding protein 1C
MDPLFNDPYSTVLLDREGVLLAASAASDGQWRMPMGDSIPKRFERCLVEFEDRSFHRHWGIRPGSILRAWQQNRRAGRVVSGGSTITMQVARMARGHRPRTMRNKVVECLLALRMEIRWSKAEILRLYCGHAPFGGNVAGLEAAAWRWYGKAPHELGWGECATLAVLPNAPARIHPGRNRDALLAKRNRLLDRLLATGGIDSLQWSLAREEPLPDRPHALPRSAPHLLGTLKERGHQGQRIRTTLDRALQERVNEALLHYGPVLRANEVHNAAVVVLDASSGEALAYAGNLPDADADHAGQVDIVQAPRSTGSLLKPFLYAAMLQAGERMPDQLVADLPTSVDGFSPRNYDERYDGAVPASQALARSLNVPAVRALREHGVERARRMLQEMGLRHLTRSADHYGLSLIVGGGEGSLWELTGAYASLARTLRSYSGSEESVQGAVHGPYVLEADAVQRSTARPPLSAGAVFHTLEALRTVHRPAAEAGWQHWGEAGVAWKTGTSYGHRDGWAIGTTDRYTVGVWTGNASGEGRPGLTGTLAAAPLLFEVFAMLPVGHGFDPPYETLERRAVCKASGYLAGPDCEPVEERWVLHEAVRTSPCPYHRRILVDPEGRYRVPPGPEARPVSWFCLPPAMEYYYAQGHPNYRTLPPWREGTPTVDEKPLQAIYPERGSVLLVPVELNGRSGRVVLQAAHNDPEAVVHWDLDGQHLGSTRSDHRLAAALPAGAHVLTLTDGHGFRTETVFRVVSSLGEARQPASSGTARTGL